MNQQDEMAHFTGEITEPEPAEEKCKHAHARWNPNTGEFRCLNRACDEQLYIPELTESLSPEWEKPYDLILDL